MKWRWRVWRNASGIWVASLIDALTGRIFRGIAYQSADWRSSFDYALGWVRWEAESSKPELGRMR
jgi:hypothetical protein